MLTMSTESVYNGHPSIRTGPSSNGRRLPGPINHFLLQYVDGLMRVCRLPGEEMVPVYTMGRRQARVPCHTAKTVQEWFEEHSKELNVLTWPLNSPDLNPIKHLLDVLEKQV